MQRLCTTGMFALGFLFVSNTIAFAAPLPEQTFTLPQDRLEVTVASASLEQKDPLESELTIWVGEIELNGRKTNWVELIDSFGEVIYDSEVNSNETHLLPDGRAVVIRAVDKINSAVAKDTSRVPGEGALSVTRRVFGQGAQATTIELIETVDQFPKEQGTMLQIASFGEMVWENITSFFSAAGTRVKVAWNWLVDSIQV